MPSILEILDFDPAPIYSGGGKIYKKEIDHGAILFLSIFPAELKLSIHIKGPGGYKPDSALSFTPEEGLCLISNSHPWVLELFSPYLHIFLLAAGVETSKFFHNPGQYPVAAGPFMACIELSSQIDWPIRI